MVKNPIYDLYGRITSDILPREAYGMITGSDRREVVLEMQTNNLFNILHPVGDVVPVTSNFKTVATCRSRDELADCLKKRPVRKPGSKKRIKLIQWDPKKDVVEVLVG